MEELLILVQTAQEACHHIGFVMHFGVLNSIEVMELLECADGTVLQIPMESAGECPISSELEI